MNLITLLKELNMCMKNSINKYIKINTPVPNFLKVRNAMVY